MSAACLRKLDRSISWQLCFLQLIFGRCVLEARGIRQSIRRDTLSNSGRGRQGELLCSFII